MKIPSIFTALFTSVLLCCGIAYGQSSQILPIEIPTPDDYLVPSDLYEVTINGQSVPVYMNQDHAVDPNFGYRKPRHFVLFNMKGVADVEVRLLQPQSNEAVYPSRYHITPVRTADPDGDILSFTINRSRYHVLTFNEQYDGLIFFADPIVDNPPQVGDANVVSILDYGLPNDGSGDVSENTAIIEQAMEEVGHSDTLDVLYFPAGFYRFEGVYLHEDVVAYFAPGSRMHITGGFLPNAGGGHWYGGLQTTFRHRSQILGRGVFTFPYKMGSVTLDRSENHVMEGVLTLHGKTLGYIVRDARIRYVKALTDPEGGSGGDASIWTSMQDTEMESIFTCAGDDSTSLKSDNWGGSRAAYNSYGVPTINLHLKDYMSNGTGYRAMRIGSPHPTDGGYENVFIEDYSAIHEDGYHFRIADHRDSAFKNLRIDGYHSDLSGRGLLVATDLEGDGPYYYIPGNRPGTGNLKNVHLSNSYIKGLPVGYGNDGEALCADGFTFENVFVNGQLQDSLTDFELISPVLPVSPGETNLPPAQFLSPLSVKAGYDDSYAEAGRALPLIGRVLHATSSNWSVVDQPTGASVVFADTTDPRSAVTFSAAGLYTLRLSATNGVESDADEVTYTVLSGSPANALPVASFKANPMTSGRMPHQVTVDATGATAPGGDIVRYDWDFGDGTVIPDGNPVESHTYTVEGLYTCTLTVTDSQELSDSTHLYLQSKVMQFPFGFGEPATIPGRIETEEYDEGGLNVAYGKGYATYFDHLPPFPPLEEGPTNVRKTYYLGGDSFYYDNLEILDGGSGQYIGELERPQSNWYEYTVDVTQSGTYDIRVNVMPHSTWRDFSLELDGVDITGNVSVGRGTDWTVVTVPDVSLLEGEYILRVNKGADLKLDYYEFVLVGSPVPTADFLISPPKGLAPLEVTVDASPSSGNGDTLVRYDWDFGDGTLIHDGNPVEQHVYSTDGTYDITLTVTNQGGNSDAHTVSYFVGNRLPEAQLTVQPEFGPAPLTIALDASGSLDPDGSLVRYDWDFGDGTVLSDGGPNPGHSYMDEGTYTASVTVIDHNGGTDSASVEVFVGNYAPTAALEATPRNGLAPLSVAFDAGASSDLDGTIVRYDWDFGDGTTLQDGGATPSHEYTTNGENTATVTVTDDQGATGQASAIIKVGEAEWLFLLNFGDSPYVSDGINSWQSFDLSTVAEFQVNGAPVHYTDVPLADTDGDDSLGLLFSIASSGVSDNAVSIALSTADDFALNPFDWFNPNSPEQIESHVFANTDDSWTYTFSGFDPADTVTFEFVIGEDRTSREVTFTYNPGMPDEAVLLNNVDIGSVTHYPFKTATGASEYAFRLTNRNDGWVSLVNAMGISVLRLPPQAPELPRPVLSLDVSDWVLTVPSESGYKYQVRTNTTLEGDPASWEPAGISRPGNDATLEFLLPVEEWPVSPRRFFVIEQIPE